MAGHINSLDARWLREGAQDDAEFESFLQRRAVGEPVHRILGWREFWGMKFYLSPGTLEPRPDSETMIEVLLSSRAKRSADPGSRDDLDSYPSRDPGSLLADASAARDDMKILDLGTGTGCLLLAALKEFPNAVGIGIDQSADAIATAAKNATENNLQSRAEFLQMDWHDKNKLHALGKFDVILCNPPYIPSRDIETLQPEVRNHDPMAALDGGDDGLHPYRHIAAQLHYLLSPAGIALLEFGHDQAAAVRQILESHGLSASQAIKDLGGNNRIIVATLPGNSGGQGAKQPAR